MTVDEVLEQFPVTREQVKAVLEFAARSLDALYLGADAHSLRQRYAERRHGRANGPHRRGGPNQIVIWLRRLQGLRGAA
jgi:hypothetical protein